MGIHKITAKKGTRRELYGAIHLKLVTLWLVESTDATMIISRSHFYHSQ